MKFTQLPVPTQIEYIKDKYIKIIVSIVRDKSKLTKYISCEDKPALLDPTDPATKKMAADVIEQSNLKTQKEWEEKKQLATKITEILSTVKEDEKCICVPREVSLEFCLNSVIPEFELFIDAARAELEKQEFDA